MGNVVCCSFPDKVIVHHMALRKPPRSPSPVVIPHLEPGSPSILDTFMKVEQA